MKLANDTCNLNSNGKPDWNAKRGLIQDFPLEEKSTGMAESISFKIICYLDTLDISFKVESGFSFLMIANR